jgi:hypothetical protein
MIGCLESEKNEVKSHSCPQGISSKYSFNGSISKEVLNNYLSRAIVQGELCHIEDDAEFYENIRMLRNIGAKFIRRVAFVWTPLRPEEEHFAIVKKRAEQAFQIDPEFLLQASIYEAIFHSSNELTNYGLDQIPIPAYVFEEFGLPVENRNFDYYAMLYDENKLTDKDYLYHDHWVKGASVPDLASIETQMYFYYRATRYIDVGCESIHMGQIQLMNDNDPENKIVYELFDRIRKYAHKNARRHFVILDSHVPAAHGSGKPHGIINKKGELLFDFHSFPLRPKEICTKPYHAILEVGHHDAIYQNSMGGITPSGWKCDALPYLVEFDNSDVSNPGVCGGEEWWWPWGWDETCWFAHCSNEYRNQWLKYAYNWIKKTDPGVGHMAMPGYITIAPDPIGDKWHYRLNMKSEACPKGFGQELTVKQIWQSDN